MADVNWPSRPEPLREQQFGIQWHITSKKRADGALELSCNSKKFCILQPVKGPSDRWIVPGLGVVNDRLRAAQLAGEQYLGTDSKWKTIVSI